LKITQISVTVEPNSYEKEHGIERRILARHSDGTWYTSSGGFYPYETKLATLIQEIVYKFEFSGEISSEVNKK